MVQNFLCRPVYPQISGNACSLKWHMSTQTFLKSSLLKHTKLFLAMYLLNHKIREGSFLRWFYFSSWHNIFIIRSWSWIWISIWIQENMFTEVTIPIYSRNSYQANLDLTHWSFLHTASILLNTVMYLISLTPIKILTGSGLPRDFFPGRTAIAGCRIPRWPQCGDENDYCFQADRIRVRHTFQKWQDDFINYF